ncbi:hypothetical protein [Glutamicibacter soli]
MTLVSQQGEPVVVVEQIDYEAWNDALAGAFFSSDHSGQMVYLDQDDHAFETAYVSLGLASVNEAITSLAEAVANRLCWYPSGRETFAEYDMLTKRWLYGRKSALGKKQPVPAPPHIALLMLLSIAAERMQTSASGGASGDGSYYVQLERLLEIPNSESIRLRRSFAMSSETYWEALSVWLEDFSGTKGLPSAYALMYRYVGLPISQALIRNTERRNIDRFFAEQGFIAGSSVSHAEMFAALDVWLTLPGSSANQALRIIWAKPGNQDRVTELALAQFGVWEGPKATGFGERHVSRAARCILSWRNERKLLSSVAKFGLIATHGVPEDGVGQVLVEDGTHATVSFKPAGNNSYGVSFDGHQIEPGSLVGSAISITTSEGQKLQRAPKRIVIFAKDALTASYVEVDRAVAGLETRVLLKDEERLVSNVEAILKDSAQPSYRKVEGGGTEGIPQGWVAYVDVTFLRAPNEKLVEHTDFSAFQPRLTTQMTLQGGLRLPGRTRHWSSLAPMSLVITSEDQGPVDLYRIDRDPESLKTTDVLLHENIVPPFKVGVKSLSGGHADFTLSLRRKKKTLQNLQIRLRHADSSDSADPEQLRSIAHAVGTALWPLTAVEEADTATGWIMGANIEAAPFSGDLQDCSIPDKVTWSGRKNFGMTRAKLKLPKPGEKSCVVTGRHVFTVPTFDGKYPKTPWMYAQCNECGISKRYPTRIKDARKKEYSGTVARKSLPKVSAAPANPNLNAMLDAMMFLGEGTRKEFSVLARQLEDSALFERALLLSLESLAFIEVERDERLEIVAWESAYQCVAGADDGTWLLTGPWSNALVKEISAGVSSAGGSVKESDVNDMILAHFADISRRKLVGILEEYVNEEDIVPRNGLSLAEALPPMSTIVRDLTREPFPSLNQYEYFLLDSATWIESQAAEIPGLYRLSRVQGAGYFLRTEADIESGTGARVWAELGKHLAANILKKPLLSYDSNERKLRVPLGASLPGLYGRSAVLASGGLPDEETRLNSITYNGISPETATVIIRKVMS